MSETSKDDDGYIVAPPRKTSASGLKGVKCGACGMKFDHDKAYGYSCSKVDCPIFYKATL